MTGITKEAEHLPRTCWIAVGAGLLIFILLGHFGLFTGATFLVEEDPVIMFEVAARNAASNGWIPGEGLGTSHFYGDPGAHHVWSPWSLWHRFFSDQLLAYSSSIVILLLAASLAQFALIRRAAPALALLPSVLLSTLVVFGSLRYEFFFQRHWIMLTVGAPLVTLVLYDFYVRPKAQHYFQYTAILFASLVLGSMMPFLELLILSAVIYACLWQYHRTAGLPNCRPAGGVGGFLLLNLGAVLSVLALGAWEGYSIIYERMTVDYVRDAKNVVLSMATTFSWPSFRSFLMKLSEYLHAGVLSPWMMSPGLPGLMHLPMASWNNVSPFVPIVLLLALGRRRATFWEFLCKRLVLLFFLYEGVLLFIPGLMSPLEHLLKVYHLGKFHPAYQPFEAALIAILLVQAGGFTASGRWKPAARGLAGLLAGLYGSLFAAALLARLAAGLDKTRLAALLETGLSPFTTEASLALKHFMLSVLAVNLGLFAEQSGVLLLFYGLTCLGMVAVAWGLWPAWARTKDWAVPALLAAVNVLLAWAIYPLNNQPLIEDDQRLEGRRIADVLGPTDRMARVGVSPCWSRDIESDRLACYQTRLYTESQEPRRYKVGYRLVPRMDFTAVKSFSQKEIATFVVTLLEAEGHSVPVLRALQVNPMLHRSQVYDLAAVKYLLSEFALDASDQLRPAFQGKQLYLYENANAWPYFYVANRIAAMRSYEDLLSARKGEAYLWSADQAADPARWQRLGNASDVSIRMTAFRQGEMEFAYRAEKEGFLIVADAWHPRWKASVDETAVSILKANGVFKGVVLPEGRHVLRLYFDPAPYRAGIAISCVAAALFLAGWAYCILSLRSGAWARLRPAAAGAKPEMTPGL